MPSDTVHETAFTYDHDTKQLFIDTSHFPTAERYRKAGFPETTLPSSAPYRRFRDTFTGRLPIPKPDSRRKPKKMLSPEQRQRQIEHLRRARAIQTGAPVSGDGTKTPPRGAAKSPARSKKS